MSTSADCSTSCSLYRSLSQRQLRSTRVYARPDLTDLSSQGLFKGSGIYASIHQENWCPALALSFAKIKGDGHLLAVADEDGIVTLLNSEQRFSSSNAFYDEESVKRYSWSAHRNAIFDVCWLRDDAQMLTASGDQTIRLWDVERHKHLVTMKGHNGSVKTISKHPFSPDIFASGSRDGNVALWDSRLAATSQSIQPTACIKGAHVPSRHKSSRRQKASSYSVTAVLYLKSDNLLATAGAADGTIKFWDTRKLKDAVTTTSPQQGDPVEGKRIHGFGSLAEDSSGSYIIASCTDSKIYMYNAFRPEDGPIKSFSGHVMGSFYVKCCFSPDGMRILSGSTDGRPFIWQVDKPEKAPIALQGHEGEVTAVDWCPTDFCKIATSSDDYMVRIWSIEYPAFEQPFKRSMVDDNTPQKQPHCRSPTSVLSPPTSAKRQRSIAHYFTSV